MEVGPGLHEWIGGGRAWGEAGAASGQASGTEAGPAGDWLAPLGVLIEVARAGVGHLGADARVLWIGRRVWPSPAALVSRPGRVGEDRSLLERSLFVDARDAKGVLWAADTALRSSAGVVVADGSGLDMASTRRLQLGAEASGSHGAGVCLLARPLRERRSLSAAATRWLVEPDGSDEQDRPGWAVQLLRRKGLRPEEGHTLRWVVRSCHATGDVRVVAVTADRPGPPAQRPAARTGS